MYDGRVLVYYNLFKKKKFASWLWYLYLKMFNEFGLNFYPYHIFYE